MAENKQQQEPEEAKPKKGYLFLPVWSVPISSQPILRIEVGTKVIPIKQVFKLACDALRMYKESRKFFALFRGALHPLKKYGTEECIMLPFKATLTLQRWCFDLTAEISIIKTDAAAFQIIANQVLAEIEDGKLEVTEKELEPLKRFYKGQFVCYKQFVDMARELPSYSSLMIKNVEVVNKAQIANTTISEGTKLDIIINSKRMHLVSDSIELGIPWRKIRWFAEVREKKMLSLEIFLPDDKSFTWLELCTPQFTFLLQAIGECIDMLQARLEKPLFPQPKFVTQKKRNKLSWTFIKRELFGIGKQNDEFFSSFDSFEENEFSESDENNTSSDEDDDDWLEESNNGSNSTVKS